MLVNSQLVCLPPVGIFKPIYMFVWNICFLQFKWHVCELASVLTAVNNIWTFFLMWRKPEPLSQFKLVDNSGKWKRSFYSRQFFSHFALQCTFAVVREHSLSLKTDVDYRINLINLVFSILGEKELSYTTPLGLCTWLSCSFPFRCSCGPSSAQRSVICAFLNSDHQEIKTSTDYD